ncbi:Yip1 family protein [Pseudophaeobacter leonis]|uniref:Yip1 family protein n=1 Tax=Pseudophaeobacter leonis TaxID=1144477 RepID=UPI0009F411C9|nr:Yip1 family protein [Pseudophaeobacter leonis]
MSFLWSFVILTLRQPGAAAGNILLRQWPAEAVWTGLLLAIALNVLFFSSVSLFFPLEGDLVTLNLMPDSMGISIFTAAIRSVGFAAVLTLGGRWLGGTASFMPMLSLLVWHQLVQIIALLAVILIMAFSPSLGALFALLVGVVLFFVLLNFVNEAHGFASLWRAFAVIVMATILMFFAMIFVVGLIGPDYLGLPENV